MVEQIGATTAGNKKDFGGLASDVKPTTDCGPGSTFYEADTTNGFIFINNTWWPA